jgi:hypothetical protein
LAANGHSGYYGVADAVYYGYVVGLGVHAIGLARDRVKAQRNRMYTNVQHGHHAVGLAVHYENPVVAPVGAEQPVRAPVVAHH